MSYASRKTAALSSISDSETALRAAAEVFFRKEIRSDDEIKSYVFGGNTGISLLSSDFGGDKIVLEASYKILLPIRFFPVQGVSVEQRSVSRKWTGEQPIGLGEASYVYITPDGEAYHSSKSCHYLDLSVQMVKSADLAALRNKNEHKYYACERCAAGKTLPPNVYITDYGTAYHGDLQCSGLKRTIIRIPLSETGDRRACTKCTAGKEKR